jgi:hypothetical protein
MAELTTQVPSEYKEIQNLVLEFYGEMSELPRMEVNLPDATRAPISYKEYENGYIETRRRFHKLHEQIFGVLPAKIPSQ